MSRIDVVVTGSGPGSAAVCAQLRAAGLAVYWGPQDAVPGEPWMPALERALDQAHTVVVTVDVGGQDRSTETALVMEHAIGTGKRMIPVLLAGARADDRMGFLRTRQPALAQDVPRLAAQLTKRR